MGFPRYTIELLLLVQLLIPATTAYELHQPLFIENIETTPEEPLIIEGYEITNSDGYCIQIHHVEHVIIRDNYLHDCGTALTEEVIHKMDRGKDAGAAMVTNADVTGAINIWEAKSVEIRGNEVINNDYGIRVHSSSNTDRVKIAENSVKNNKRAYFIHVLNAKNVEIFSNQVLDNGLSRFIDNEALGEAFERGEDFGDGRSQGIMCGSCKDVDIYRNIVINSTSDGIGLGGDLEREDYSENFRIYNNTVMWNAEQGLWILTSRNGEIFNNRIWKNTARPDTTGGSSGIMFETHVFDVDIFNNDIAYNDMFGIHMAMSTRINITDNEIHHNADGAIAWGEWFTREGRFKAKGFNEGVNIEDNYIHDNMGSVFGFLTDVFEDKVSVIGNKIERNGIRIRHFQEFADHDISNHPEIWVHDGENRLFVDESFISQFNFIDNQIVEAEDYKGNEMHHIEHDSKKHDQAHDSIFEEIKESWQAVAIGVFLLISVISAILYRRRCKVFV